MRILVLIAIGLLLYIIIGNLLRRNRRLPGPNSQAKTEKMVKCHQCNLHILEQEAIKHGVNYYCSQEHIDLEQ